MRFLIRNAIAIALFTLICFIPTRSCCANPVPISSSKPEGVSVEAPLAAPSASIQLS